MKLGYIKYPLMALCVLSLANSPSFSMTGEESEQSNRARPIYRVLTSYQGHFDDLSQAITTHNSQGGKRVSDPFYVIPSIRNILSLAGTVLKSLAEFDLDALQGVGPHKPISFDELVQKNVELTEVADLPRLTGLLGRALSYAGELDKIEETAGKMYAEQEAEFCAALKEKGLSKQVREYEAAKRAFTKKFPTAQSPNTEAYNAALQKKQDAWRILTTAAENLDIKTPKSSSDIEKDLKAHLPLRTNFGKLKDDVTALVPLLSGLGISVNK